MQSEWMSSESLASFFYSELTEGKRNPGRPKKRYKDNLKANLKWTGIELKELETAASNRSGWRATTTTATRNFEKNRRLFIAAARDRRKKAAKNPITTRGTPCPICNRICASKFGLENHMRAHH